MKPEIMKSIKNCAFLNAHFEIHKQFRFCFCPIMQKRLAITRIWLSQNKGRYCKFIVKTQVHGSWGVDHTCIHIYIYIYVCSFEVYLRWICGVFEEVSEAISYSFRGTWDQILAILEAPTVHILELTVQDCNRCCLKAIYACGGLQSVTGLTSATVQRCLYS